MTAFDVLTVTASDLHGTVQGGLLTSEDIAIKHPEHARKHNGPLRAVVELASEDYMRWEARQLDEERKKGQIRGPLHGTPIIIKVRRHLAYHPRPTE